MDEIGSGISVLITGAERLAAIMDIFSPTLDSISPLGIEDVADQYATLVEVMEAPEHLQDLGEFAVLILESGQDIVLPLAAFEPVKMTIDELEESYDFRNANKAPLGRHIHPKDQLVYDLAAQSIQTAFRFFSLLL